MYVSQQTQTICITFIQRRPNVFDVGPTLYKCYKKCFVFTGVLRSHIFILQHHVHSCSIILWY